MRILRQGDVLLIAISKLPQAAVEIDRGNDPRGLILAIGEGANHAHAILNKNVHLYQHEEGRYVVVGGKSGATLRHVLPGMVPTGDHGDIKLPQGVYKFVRQNEYRDSTIVTVSD